jgi:TonB-linked outer membrane protein, SusC/RagA family
MNLPPFPKGFGALLFFVLLSAGLFAQQRTITGQVNDENNMPLPGVSITLKGTNQTSTTDTSGHFSVTVPSTGAVLVFSYVGYQPREIAVGESNTLNVNLLSTSSKMDEVVVVGYGSQARRNVTGSVAKIDMSQTENTPITSFTQALRGRVAGVQFADNGRPGQGGSIIVRGDRSLSGSDAPLIILDGVFFYGEYSDINPNDIESMQVLKDASATAIYGTRAANGVIIITTKKGAGAKPTIRFNAFYGASGWSKKMNLYGPEAYLQRILDYRAQNGQRANPDSIRFYLQTTEQEMYDAGKTVDPWDVVSQDAAIQSYDMSVSGRTDKTSYFLSANYVNDKGLILNDNAKRITVRMNLDNKITNWLTIGLNSQFTRRDLSGIRAPLDMAYWLSPYAKLYFDDGELVPYPAVDNLEFNPLFAPTYHQNKALNYSIFGTAYAIVSIPQVKGLSYRFNYNPRFTWDQNYLAQPVYNRPGAGYVNTGLARRVNQQNASWQYENILTYSKNLGDHDFDLTLLYGQDHQEFDITRAESRNIFNDALGYNNLNIGTTQTTPNEPDDVEISNSVSSMARLNYRFKNRYLLTLTARRDGSSRFGVDKKYGTFPSAAVAWIVSDEAFMDKLTVFDMLKLRLSYGKVGNIAGGPYQSLGRFITTQYVFGDGSPTYTGVYSDWEFMPQPNLGWETTTAFNAGIDFEILKNRIGGTIEYYYTKTTDMLQQQTVSTLTGFQRQYINIGQVDNKGVEITLNTTNIKTKQFSWTSNIIFAANKNKIVHIKHQDTDKDGVEDDDLANNWFIGSPISVNFDYEFDGIYQEGETMPAGYKPGWIRVKDQNKDGKITADDRVILGQRDPKYRWGITNTFSYGNLTLSFFINAMQEFMAPFNMLSVENSRGGGSFPGRPVNMLDAGYWTPENKSNARPSLNWTNPLNMQFYAKRDFVRLQDISLAYDFPKSITERYKLTNLRLFVSGRNLATWTDWPGPDPESGNNTITNLYPTPRTVTVGLNLGF